MGVTKIDPKMFSGIVVGKQGPKGDTGATGATGPQGSRAPSA